MPGATLTTLSDILKDFYLPPVVEQLNNEILLLSRLESRSQELFGNQAVIPLHTTRSGGIGARAEGVALANYANQDYDRATFDLKYLYGRISVTGPAMAKTASEAGSFLQALKSELDGIRNDLKKDTARQTYGSSDSGTEGRSFIATCGTTSASATVVLNTDEALRKGHIHVGMRVNIGTSSNENSLVDNEAVTAVDIANKTFTVSTSISTTTSNFVSRSGNAADSGAGQEITGLATLVSNAANTVGGIDASAAGKSYWDNQRATSVGALTLDALTKAFNTVRVQGGDTSLMLTTFGVQRVFYNLLQTQVRYQDPMKLESGFQTLSYMNRPFVADVDAQFGKIFLLDEKFIKVFSNRDWHFLDEDGNVLKWVTGYDQWEAALARYMNLGISRRNVQYVLAGITDATGV